MQENGDIKSHLAAEVVHHRRVVGAGLPGEDSRRHAGKAESREELVGRVEQALLGPRHRRESPPGSPRSTTAPDDVERACEQPRLDLEIRLEVARRRDERPLHCRDGLQRQPSETPRRFLASTQELRRGNTALNEPQPSRVLRGERGLVEEKRGGTADAEIPGQKPDGSAHGWFPGPQPLIHEPGVVRRDAKVARQGQAKKGEVDLAGHGAQDERRQPADPVNKLEESVLFPDQWKHRLIEWPRSEIFLCLPHRDRELVSERVHRKSQMDDGERVPLQVVEEIAHLAQGLEACTHQARPVVKRDQRATFFVFEPK